MRSIVRLAAVAALLVVASLLGASDRTEGDLPSSVRNAGLADPLETYDPVREGEEQPDGFRQLLPRDAIAPVYEPAFRSAPDTPWPDDTLVIGLEIDDEAKAYPISFLNRREMVVDRLAGIPILVTW